MTKAQPLGRDKCPGGKGTSPDFGRSTPVSCESRTNPFQLRWLKALCKLGALFPLRVLYLSRTVSEQAALSSPSLPRYQ